MINLGGGPPGNPGFSAAADKYNPQTGRYERQGAVFMGQGQAPAGAQDQFRQFLNNGTAGAGNNITFAQQQGGQFNPAQNTGQSPVGQGRQPPVMDNAYYNGLDQAGQANFNSKMGQDPRFIAAMQAAQNAGQGAGQGQGVSQPGQQPGGVQAGGPGGYNPGGGGAQWQPGQIPPQNVAASVQGGQLGGTFGQAAPGVAPPTGLIGSEMAMQQGLSGALGGIQGGLNNFNQQAGAASSLLGGYAGNGQNAANMQAAQSGALGPQAQQEAFDNFNSSPGQQWLQDRGQRAITRNAAALGGLGGGNVQKALMQYGQGMAQQDFDNQFNRLGGISNQGFQATQLQSGIAQNQGQAGMNAGMAAADLNYNSGQNYASGRTRAGEQIADSVANTTSGLSALINQQGQNLSNIVGAGGNNISSLLAGLGQQTGMSQEQLASLLGNISIGQGSQVAGLPALGQFVQPDNTLNSIGQVASGVGNAITAYNSGQQTPPPVRTPAPVSVATPAWVAPT
jgi:hypothetical protein